MPPRKRHFVVFCDPEREAEKISELVYSRDHTASLARSFKQVNAQLLQTPDAGLLVHISDVDGGLEEKINEILQNSDLTDVPLLLIAPGASELKSGTLRKFHAAVALEYPYEWSELGRSMELLEEAIEGHQRGTTAQIAPEKGIEGEDDLIPWQHVLYEQCTSIPELIFHINDKLKLTNRTLGGSAYIGARDINSLTHKDYLSTNELALDAVEDICNGLGEARRASIHRIAYLSKAMFSVFSDSDELLESSRVAALVYGWEVEKGKRHLLTTDYTASSEGTTIRYELARRIKDCAIKIGLESDLQVASGIVANLGRVIAREEASTDDPLSMVSSAIMAADFTERVCWQNGTWSVSAAHRMLCKSRTGKLNEFHPSVLGCLIKFLVEAVQATAPNLIKRESVKNPKSTVIIANPIEKEEVIESETRVSISELSPGMRLARPLLAYDGKEVLSEDMILDHDLIYRIWTLSAIRALKTPLVIAMAA